MSELRPIASVAEWWRVERPQIEAEFPQHCDVVIARTQAAMQRAQSERDTTVLADAAAIGARAHVIKGQPENAVLMLDELLRAPGDQFAPTDRAAMTSSLGVAYDAMGKHPEALDCLQEAHAAFTEAGDARGMANARMAMGVVHSRCCDYTIGAGHYVAALGPFELLNDHPSTVRVLNNMGLNQRNLGQLDASLATFDRAINLATKHALIALLPVLSGNRGRTLLALGRLDEAAAGFDEHVRGSEGNAWVGSRIDAQLGHAQVASARGQHAQVVAVLTRLIPLLAKNSPLDDEVRAWGLLAESLEAEGDAAGALHAYKQLRERERLWLDHRANTRMRASAVMTDLHAARYEAKEEHRLRHELAKAHAALAIESAERRARADELYQQSREDGLTGLPNRRDFTERMAEECRRAQRFDESLCIAMVDIDHFKRVNDTHGHVVGDQVLIEVARRLRSALRSGDLVARLGGEEFAVLLPDATPHDAVILCERLREAVAGSPIAINAKTVTADVTVSVGFTCFVPPETTDTALSRADARLYAAKRAGRNCVTGD
ncbi:MAG: diguanylate cyclase [Casimicrobium sp.]